MRSFEANNNRQFLKTMANTRRTFAHSLRSDSTRSWAFTRDAMKRLLGLAAADWLIPAWEKRIKEKKKKRKKRKKKYGSLEIGFTVQLLPFPAVQKEC